MLKPIANLAPASLLALALAAPAVAQPVAGSIVALPQPAACANVGRLDTAITDPRVGRPFNAAASWGHRPQGAGVALFMFDFGGRAWNGLSIPQPLGGPIPALQGCLQFAAADLTITLPVFCVVENQCQLPQPPCPVFSCGAALAFPVPANNALVGLRLGIQSLLFDVPTATSPLARATSALAVTFGG